MGDKTRGLYDKFVVERVDGRDTLGQKHDRCDYFVLDVTHDPYAVVALEAYAKACQVEYPKLAADIDFFYLTPHDANDLVYGEGE